MVSIYTSEIGVTLCASYRGGMHGQRAHLAWILMLMMGPMQFMENNRHIFPQADWTAGFCALKGALGCYLCFALSAWCGQAATCDTFCSLRSAKALNNRQRQAALLHTHAHGVLGALGE